MKITERKCKHDNQCSHCRGGTAAIGSAFTGGGMERGKSGYRISQREDYQGANQ